MMDFEIVEMEEFSGEKAHIYSVCLNGCEESLLEQFFEENECYQSELTTIVEKLLVMGKTTGCRRTYFKHNEGTLGDGVAVLKAGQLRLYCLYFDNTAVFFGSGGYKPKEVHAYQEVPELNSKAQQMRQIATVINQKIKDKEWIIDEDGNLIMKGE